MEDRTSGDSMSDQIHNGKVDGSPPRAAAEEHSSRGEKRRLMLTQILNCPVLNPAGDELGRLEDVIVKLGDGGYPPVTGIKVRLGGSDVYVGMSDLEELAPGHVRLRTKILHTGAFQRRPGEVLLFSPRLWGELSARNRQRPAIHEARYVFDPTDLDALGEQLGWSARPQRVSHAHP